MEQSFNNRENIRQRLIEQNEQIRILLEEYDKEEASLNDMFNQKKLELEDLEKNLNQISEDNKKMLEELLRMNQIDFDDTPDEVKKERIQNSIHQIEKRIESLKKFRHDYMEIGFQNAVRLNNFDKKVD
jgi:chromosome segregation ATPase